MFGSLLAGAQAPRRGIAVLVVALLASLLAVLPGGSVAQAAPTSSNVTVTGDTASAENDPGWLFNRDTANVTPYVFNTVAASTGAGSLYVQPITNAVPGDKFVGELFLDTTVGGLGTTSFDFRLGAGVTDYQQFYWNVYANFPSSPSNKYYDCRYAFVATSGSSAGFTTVAFDANTVDPNVVTRGSSPSPCPTSLTGMGASANVRAAVLNVGDTSSSDTGVAGYLDNVIATDNAETTTYDFEVPTSSNVTVVGNNASAENVLGWMFNRDTANSTPFEFNTNAQSIGAGSLYVRPIANVVPGDKFVGELFLDSTVAQLGTTSLDFRLGAGVADYQQFYWNVYANFPSSPSNKYYDCRFAFVATSGSSAGFTTLAFTKTSVDPNVVTRGGATPSPSPCPTTLAGMGATANVRAAVINVGDSSSADTGVSGYLDNVISKVNGAKTTYDFETDPSTLAYTGATSGTNTTAIALSAKLTSVFQPGGVAGKTISFTLGSQSAVGTTNALGVATASLVANQPAGSLTVGVAFTGGGALPAASGTATFALARATTALTVANPGPLRTGQARTLQAKLVNTSAGNAVLAGRTVSFQACSPMAVCSTVSGITSALGIASAVYIAPGGLGAYTLTATVATDPGYLGSNASSTFSVFSLRSQLGLAVTSGKYGGAFLLTATASSINGAITNPMPNQSVAYYRMPSATETNVANGTYLGSSTTRANGSSSLIFRMDTMPVLPNPGTNFSFRAVYAGSLTYGPSQSATATTPVVKRATSLTGTAPRVGANVSINLLLKKEGLTYTALGATTTTVTMASGPLPGQTVGFRWANAAGTVVGSFSGTTDVNGRVIMTRAIPAGATKLRVAYSGRGGYDAAPPGLPFAL